MAPYLRQRDITFIFGLICLGVLWGGAATVGDAITYDHMAWAIVAIMIAVSGRDTLKTLGEGTGLKSVAQVLWTDRTPGDATKPATAAPAAKPAAPAAPEAKG